MIYHTKNPEKDIVTKLDTNHFFIAIRVYIYHFQGLGPILNFKNVFCFLDTEGWRESSLSVGALFITEGIFLQTMRNNIQSLVKIVWEMNLKISRSKHQKYFWEPKPCWCWQWIFFNKNTKSNFSSERLDHFSLAKSAQHEVQTNKKINKQTEYQNIKVWECVLNV